MAQTQDPWITSHTPYHWATQDPPGLVWKRVNITSITYPLHVWSFNPLPDNKVLDWSKLKQIEDNIFKFDENSRKFSKWVENTVGRGEIARYEQFLLFPQCFQKGCFLQASKGVIVWEWVKITQK